jgi:transcriptional regulator with PAS, ATPase and Fis domain
MKKTARKSLLYTATREHERKTIREAIAHYGSRVKAAAALGISTMTLRTKLK